MHLWIIEDEVHLAQHLIRLLVPEGYTCRLVQSSGELNYLLSDSLCTPPDVVLMDRWLHGVDVTMELARLKNKWVQTPVVILSATGTSRERAELLDAGADDYLNKPFSSAELLARLKKVLRLGRSDSSTQPHPSSSFAASKIELDHKLMDIIVRGHRAHLTQKEFLLAKRLFEHPREVFNRFRLLDLVWGIESEVQTHVVESTINSLRRKLEKLNAHVMIKNRRNLGYWLEI